MKLNPDCIRDIMLILEEELAIDWNGTFVCADVIDIAKHDTMIGTYRPEDMKYSIIQLHESGYIISDLKINTEHFKYSLKYVFYITPKGHEFVASIKSKESWGKVKPILGALGGISLGVIESISNGVSSAVIEKLIPTVL